jgi:hypothetical protein
VVLGARKSGPGHAIQGPGCALLQGSMTPSEAAGQNRAGYFLKFQ